LCFLSAAVGDSFFCFVAPSKSKGAPVKTNAPFFIYLIVKLFLAFPFKNKTRLFCRHFGGFVLDAGRLSTSQFQYITPRFSCQGAP